MLTPFADHEKGALDLSFAPVDDERLTSGFARDRLHELSSVVDVHLHVGQIARTACEPEQQPVEGRAQRAQTSRRPAEPGSRSKLVPVLMAPAHLVTLPGFRCSRRRDAGILRRAVEPIRLATSLCELSGILSKLGFGAKPIALGVTRIPLALLVKLIGAKADLLFTQGLPLLPWLYVVRSG